VSSKLANSHFKDTPVSERPSGNQFTKRMTSEWAVLSKSLPAGTYVRLFKDRMDIAQFCIQGAVDTPYHNALFLFDVRFPADYPISPPQLFFHSRGQRLHPNLYVDGKVCLSLLGTWPGRSMQKWLPESSNLLQVVVSLQGLVIGSPEPYYLEAGYEKYRGTPAGAKSSRVYNETALLCTLQHMAASVRSPPKLFARLHALHFAAAAASFRELSQCGVRDSKNPRSDEKQQCAVLSSYGVKVSESLYDWPSRGFFAALAPSIAKLLQAISSQEPQQ